VTVTANATATATRPRTRRHSREPASQVASLRTAARRYRALAPPCVLVTLERALAVSGQILMATSTGFFLYTPDLRHHDERMRAAGVEFLELPRAEPYGMGACGKVPTVTTCVGSWLPTEQPSGSSLRAHLCQLG